MKNQDGYKSCLKSIMDFPMQTALVQALKDDEVKDFSKGLPKLYESLSNDFIYPNPKNILVFGDNHDMNRLFTQLNKDIDLTKMAVAYLLTTRGIPQMLYGTEVLLDNTGKLENHGIIRSDFPGGWKEDSINGFSGMGLATEVYGFQDYVRKLLNWRKANPVISNGKLTHFVPFEGLYVYFRYDEKKTVMVVLNKNKSAVNVDLKRFAEILAGKTLAKNILNNEEFPLNNSISVSPTSALIVEVR
jgi:glycosidase